MARKKSAPRKQPEPRKASRLILKCYCCGEPLGNEFAIATPADKNEAIDRALLMKPEHVTRVIGDFEVVLRNVRVHKPHEEGNA